MHAFHIPTDDVIKQIISTWKLIKYKFHAIINDFINMISITNLQ